MNESVICCSGVEEVEPIIFNQIMDYDTGLPINI